MERVLSSWWPFGAYHGWFLRRRANDSGAVAWCFHPCSSQFAWQQPGAQNRIAVPIIRYKYSVPNVARENSRRKLSCGEEGRARVRRAGTALQTHALVGFRFAT